MSVAAIKSMKLYSQNDRIYNDLANLGIKNDDPLSVDVLSAFDQFHYFGTEAVDEAIRLAGINGRSRVLDVGSGLGGPARYLAQQTGCSVTAVELQPDMNDTASALTARCSLSDQIQHVRGDILTVQLETGSCDTIVSWLALYHIPDRETLFPRLHRALGKKGQVYVEDLYKIRPFTVNEQHDIQNMLYGQTLPERDAYVAELTAAGFVDVEFQDMTESWKSFTIERLSSFRAARSEHCRVHGEEICDGLDAFYSTVARLFENGNLGGVRLTASTK